MLCVFCVLLRTYMRIKVTMFFVHRFIFAFISDLFSYLYICLFICVVVWLVGWLVVRLFVCTSCIHTCRHRYTHVKKLFVYINICMYVHVNTTRDTSKSLT